jgi:uncharacterized protein YjaG (DUF416 family)
MGDVLRFTLTGQTPDEILEAAKGKLDRVVVIGVTKEGNEHAEQSGNYSPDTYWDLHLAAYRLLKNHDEE